MARTPDNPELGARDGLIRIRVSQGEREDLERVAADLGEEELSGVLRSMTRIYDDRTVLLRAALEPLRGRLTRAEVTHVLSVQNGCYLTREVGGGPGLLGQHLAANISDSEPGDGVDTKRLLKEIGKAGRAATIALELWAESLWRRHDDDALWEREIEWLTARAE